MHTLEATVSHKLNWRWRVLAMTHMLPCCADMAMYVHV